MKLPNTLLVLSTITNVLSRRHSSGSDESVENILYFKDCNHKKNIPEPLALRTADPPTPPKPDCPFPKMCCAMSCGNECNLDQSFVSRQGPVPNYQPAQLIQTPRQPPPGQKPAVQRQKKFQIPPIGGRREFGFTKERIKTLISHDDDIRKILKDLVRVTMQKADLLEIMKTRRNANTSPTTPASDDSEEGDDTDD